MYDSISLRLKRKALNNQLAIAVGSSSSHVSYSIPQIAEGIISTYKIDFRVAEKIEFFQRWNELVKKAEESVGRPELIKFVSTRIKDVTPTFTHKMIASIPISNFIDATFDRSLFKALVEARKDPILHDWGQSQMVGIWKQSNPQKPNLFFMLPSVEDEKSFWGIYEPTGWWTQNRIQIANIDDMLSGKDLVLINYSAHEAEYLLHLSSFVTSCEKIINYADETQDMDYWARLGVCFREQAAEELITRLVPHKSGEYSEWDGFIASTSIVDIMRDKRYDCFISYFSGDKDFVDRLERDLRLREMIIWRDRREIEIGDRISGKIQEGLLQSYCFVIVLSPEALTRPYVQEELTAAYEQRISGEIKIHPVLYKDCAIPPFLAGYAYADFRDGSKYDEQVELLAQAIKNTVRRSREKQ
ncbi:MAG: toll/interleukin-1 receptor domain-containing protein [Pyrinomonadaceae bacterium]